MSGACFMCDRQAEELLVIVRVDGTAYDVPICDLCLTQTKVRSQPIRLAHELIDARNDYRARHRGGSMRTRARNALRKIS